jgi:hypothetical protein
MWIGNDVKGIFTTNLSIIFIATVLKGCWHNLIWCDMWIGTDVEECWHEVFDVLCRLERMWQDAFTANLK